LLSLLGVSAALLVTAAGAQPASTQRTQDSAFHSAALGGELHFEAYLPADYDTSGLRYPVVYFLHGLPAGAADYRGLGFVQKALDRLAARAILVVPQGARDGDSDPEYLDSGPGRRWATAIASELPHVIDARFRTIASRTGRALVGLSAGGYGAMHLAFQHPTDFSVVESWSGYFHPTDPTGLVSLDLGSQRRNDDANVHTQARRIRSRLPALPMLIAFYVGEGDTRFAAENEELNQELSRAGTAHIFRLYPGGHDERLWSRYAAAWLSLALHRLAPAR
jgi:S-formylglutathione hydrolase FrmB